MENMSRDSSSHSSGLTGLRCWSRKRRNTVFQQDTSTSNRIGNIRRGRKIIINKGKRSKLPSKGIFISRRFLIKTSLRLENKAAGGSLLPSALNSSSQAAPLKHSSCFKRAAHEMEAWWHFRSRGGGRRQRRQHREH